MGGLFKTPKPPPAPKPVRMPNATDPEVEAAGRRAREGALRRSGRLSTIMTDQTQATTGSSGQKLGA
jgi:hypothetical protein